MLIQQSYPFSLIKIGLNDYYTKSTVPKEITATALQYEPTVGDKKANEAKIAKLVQEKMEKAKQKNESLDLIVMPELSLTGPSDLLESNKLNNYAEAADGATLAFMQNLAKQYSAAIVYGFMESDGGKLYNSAALIEKDGIGILIGEDAAFPEAAGVLSVKRADIIAIPSAWNGQYGGDMEINTSLSANTYPAGSMPIWDAVAIGAQSYTIVSNFIGTKNEYKGRSAFYTLDPLYGLDQPIVASSNKEEAILIHFKTIQSDWWFNQEMLIHSRRTDYYTPLVLQ